MSRERKFSTGATRSGSTRDHVYDGEFKAVPNETKQVCNEDRSQKPVYTLSVKIGVGNL